MNLLIALLVYVVANFGYDNSADIQLCNGINVDNADKVVYIANQGYVVHFKFDDSQTFVVILDNCFDYRAYEVSPGGIQFVEF